MNPAIKDYSDMQTKVDGWPIDPAGRVPPDALLLSKPTKVSKNGCHCVEHAVTDGRRRLIKIEPFYSVSSFFVRPLFCQLITKTIGPLLLRYCDRCCYWF